MQETRTFVRLQLLQKITYEGDTIEQRSAWINNVLSSVGENGYSFATDEDGCEDTAEFTCDEMEFEQVEVYDFMGSAYEQERFYMRDIVTFKHKATGEFYVLNAENLMEF
jgi:hypothetical protein